MKKSHFIWMLCLVFFQGSMFAQFHPSKLGKGVTKVPIKPVKKTIEFDPCCPPINSESMVDLFTEDPSGSIADPYQMDFSPTAAFINQMQAYTNYINALDPNIDGLYFAWGLWDMGTGPDPLPNPIGQVGPTVYNHFVPGGSSMTNNLNFFTPYLEVNHWYRIQVGVYLHQGKIFEVRECANDDYFEFNQELSYNKQLAGKLASGNERLKKKVVLANGTKR